jgi:3-dehydroquinate synthase
VIIVNHSKGKYPIEFTEFEPTSGFLITDENIHRSYPELKADLVLPAGELTKSVEWYSKVLSTLASRGLTRKSQLVAVGGGVIGDLVGFVAATYMRGIDYHQVPTTLLAMVDSSVGGKVAIDLPEGKNLVGAFHPPSKVTIDARFLRSLSERQLSCGMAEVLKYGLILDRGLWQESNGDNMVATIQRCVDLKRQVVEADEFEKNGIRAKLNFGHTIGHAFEKLTNYAMYTHGEAISIGMVLEARLSEKLNLAPQGITEEISRRLVEQDLPTTAPFVDSIPELVQSMKIDKKSEGGELTMSLLRNIGECELVKGIPEQAVIEVLMTMDQ